MKKTVTLIAVVCSIAYANAQGKPFTPGNIVIYKVGDGTDSLTNKKLFPVTIEERSTATVFLGIAPVVQDIALPSLSGSAPAGNFLLTASGTTSTEGQITRSVDGKFIVFGGFNVGSDTSTVGFANLTSTSARVIGTIDSSGNVSTATALTGLPFSTTKVGYSPRSIVSPDGTTFYIVTSVAGFYSATSGGTTATKLSLYSKTKSPTGSPIARSLEIYNDSFYASYQSTYIPGGVTSDIALGTLGSVATPAVDTAVTALPGVDTVSASFEDSIAKYPSLGLKVKKTSPYQFVILNIHGNQVLYIADDDTNDSIAERGILKYSLEGGTWVYNGNIIASGCRGLTGYNNGDTAVLFGTSSTKLYGALDVSGWGLPPFSPAPGDSAVILDTAVKNYEFRGVAFTPGTPGVNLPVTLKSFSGSLVDGFAQLTWATANETNSKGFEIEKSADGKNFTAIGNVSANNKPSSYEFGDPTKLAGLQYYRLKITNKDGSYTYSSTLALIEKAGGKLSIFPNPVLTTATISHTLAGSSALLKITSIDGKTIATYPVQTGATETSVDVSRLVRGSYIITFENNNTRTTAQFVK